MTMTTEPSLRKQWESESYILLPRLIEPERVAALREMCESMERQWLDRGNPWEPAAPKSLASTNMRHLNHRAYSAEHPEWFPLLMDLVADPTVLAAVGEVIGGTPLFRCTSLFFHPQEGGHPGNWHRDTQFGAETVEEEKRALFETMTMSAMQMQIVLLPSDHAEVVPGSHLRWDTPEEYAIRLADDQKNNQSDAMPGAVRPHLEPGDAVAFNPNALHRGSYQVDEPRLTLMLTYTAEQDKPLVDFFSHQPWFLEAGHLDGLRPETRAFFERFVETYRQYW